MDTKTAVSDPLSKYLALKAKSQKMTPDDLALAGFQQVTKNQTLLQKAGTAYCLTEQPNLYYGVAAASAGAGVAAALFVVMIIHTLARLFKRTEKVVYVTNNTTAPSEAASSNASPGPSN